jgi:hypothetical protein
MQAIKPHNAQDGINHLSDKRKGGGISQLGWCQHHYHLAAFHLWRYAVLWLAFCAFYG